MSSKQNLDDPLANLKRYPSDWWWPTLVPWFSVIFFDIALVGARLQRIDIWLLVLLDVLHHLRLLSPLLGWASARSKLRRADFPLRRGSWLLTAAAPWWSLAIVLCGVGVSVFSFMLLSAASYVGFFVAPPVFVISRLALEVLWFRRCFRDASRIAVLEKTDDPTSGKAFRLQPVDGPIKDVTVRECDELSSSVYLVEGDSEVLWRAVVPIESLALDLRTRAPGRAGKEHET